MRIKYMKSSPQKSTTESYAYMAKMYRVPEIVIQRVAQFVTTWNQPGVYYSEDTVLLTRAVIEVET